MTTKPKKRTKQKQLKHGLVGRLKLELLRCAGLLAFQPAKCAITHQDHRAQSVCGCAGYFNNCSTLLIVHKMILLIDVN